MNKSNKKGPLSQITIIDASRVRAGPTAIRLFADMGARVIKIEIPDGAPGGDDMIGAREHDRADFENLHRNKESLTLNLKEAEGREIFFQLIREADVFIENYRPDVKFKLGIDYETLKAVNPTLVYASISGFGQDGPYSKRPGFDSIAQGMGGLMAVTGKQGEGPMRVGIPLADLCAGHFCAQGILAALLERSFSGEGQWVQTSLLESQIAMLDFQAAKWLIDKQVPVQTGNEHPLTVPTGVYKTSDGYLNLAAIGQTMWVRLCQVLDIEYLVTEPGLENDVARVRNRDRVNSVLDEIFATATTAEWIDRLNVAGVPCGPIYSVDKMFDDPQVQHLDITWTLPHPERGDMELIGTPIRMSRFPRPEHPQPAPEKGEHTDSILQELGLSTDRIAELKERHIV